jgi:hypothetical protein
MSQSNCGPDIPTLNIHLSSDDLLTLYIKEEHKLRRVD